MAGTIKAEITGLRETMAALAGVKRTVRNKILRKALDRGTQPMTKAARANAPRRFGILKKSMGRKVKTYRNSGTVVVVIGPRKGFRQTVGALTIDPIRYAHLQEFGTRTSAARPFLKPAYDQNKAQARQIMTEEIRNGIAAAAALGKKRT